MTKPYISAIAAMSENRVIGRDNALPWHIKEDFRFFKSTTMGRPIIMGRKSYESLGRPLPGRANIVITRSGGVSQVDETEGPFIAASVEEAIARAKVIAAQDGVDEIFIIGGGEIFRQTLPITDRIYLTLVHKDYEGDTFFPEFDRQEWEIVREERREGDPAFTFFTFERKTS